MFHQCLNKSQWCGRLVHCDLPELVIMRSAMILLALSLHISSGFVARVRHDGSGFHSPHHIDHDHTTEPPPSPGPGRRILTRTHIVRLIVFRPPEIVSVPAAGILTNSGP